MSPWKVLGWLLVALLCLLLTAGAYGLALLWGWSLPSVWWLAAIAGAGAGVALVPKGVYEQYRKGSGWVGYEFPELTSIDNLFYWHESAEHHPAREAFVEMLRAEFSGISEA